MKHQLGIALLASTLVALPVTGRAVETVNLTLATGHPEVFTHVRLLREYFVPEMDRRLAERGDYRINWLQAYGGTLVRTGSELQALQQGVIDIAYVPTLFYGAQLPLEQVSYQAPFISSDDATVRGAVEAVRAEVPEFAAAWSAFGSTMLTVGAICDDYNLMLREPAHSLADLQGRRIYAPGPAANWLRDTGMVAVAGNMSEYYQGLQTGIADGVLVLTSAAYPGRYHEVAPHLVQVSLGAQWCSVLAINTARLEALPPPVHEVLVEVADDYSAHLMATINDLLAQQIVAMQAEGATVTRWTEAQRAEWAAALPDIATEWAEAMERQNLPGRVVLRGLMDAARARGAEPARNWLE